MNQLAWDVWAERRIKKAVIDVWFYRNSSDHVETLQVTTVKVENEGVIHDCSLSLKYEECQKLMDALWNSGVRPTEVGSPGQLAALSAHLKDMQKIAFMLLEGTK